MRSINTILSVGRVIFVGHILDRYQRIIGLIGVQSNHILQYIFIMYIILCVSVLGVGILLMIIHYYDSVVCDNV